MEFLMRKKYFAFLLFIYTISFNPTAPKTPVAQLGKGINGIRGAICHATMPMMTNDMFLRNICFISKPLMRLVKSWNMALFFFVFFTFLPPRVSSFCFYRKLLLFLWLRSCVL